MPLAYVVDTLDGVDEPLQTYYEKTDDGKYKLSVEGVVPRAKLDEFRSNNIELTNKLKQYDGIDLTKYNEALDKAKKAKTDDDLEAVVTQRTKAMQEQHATALNEVTDKLTKAQSDLNAFSVNAAIKDAAIEGGANPKALTDILFRAGQVFKLHEGKVTAFKGGNIEYGSDGLNPKSPNEWIKELSKEAPHLFEENKGGGANHSRRTVARQNMSAADKIREGLDSR